MSDGLSEQIRRNLVAIISLILAITSLGYNTWRNEKTEYNRNIRVAGFEILVEVGNLQRVVFFSHYDMDKTLGNPRAGWSHILTINDLSQVMPEPVTVAAEKLRDTWEGNWDDLGKSDRSVEAINDAIDRFRLAVMDALRSLD